MKIIKGIKIGGLQQKIFNLVLAVIVLLIGVYSAVGYMQQKGLAKVVGEAGARQQQSITEISEQTMDAVLNTTLTQTTALQGYIADDLFNDVRTDVQTLQAFATELFEHAEYFPAHPVDVPDAANDGKATAMLVHEEGADPAASEDLGLVGNMSEIMVAMYEASDKLSSVFVGTTDGNMVLVNDRSSTYIGPDGTFRTIPVRSRPWYTQAAEAGELIFTGVELDAYTTTPMLECAAPVYRNGELAAVVSADIYLDAISAYIDQAATNGGVLCIIDGNGRILFSSKKDGSLKPELSTDAPDLRENENEELARFVTLALRERTGLEQITVDGKEYYLTAVPMPSVGWTVLSGVEKEITRSPTVSMLSQYDEINAEATKTFREDTERATNVLIGLSALLLLLAVSAALILAGRIVRPVELMTKRINELHGNNAFEMEKAYRTNDEIEILAESFASLSQRAKGYISEITRITAEKERIGTELALATQIQADMLPNIFPAFPDRAEFDIYATMDPAKEVGGDFYDFFLIDADHLGLVIADVSGKGVPAALFMMIAKILVQNTAMNGYSPAAALQMVNEQVCANNREEMFVTVWLGVLDLRTGELTAANAGHEIPALRKTDKEFELARTRHGFVLGALEGIQYRDITMKLMPGAKLFLYTDGVTEATNAEKELFGVKRMLGALNENRDRTPEEIIRGVRHAVDAFVKDAEQFDDMTMLCLEYRGDTSSKAPAPEDAAEKPEE